MKLLEGKNTIVTGATRGIGREIALEFARQGANVAFTYRSSEEKAKSLSDELAALGVKAVSIKSDAGDPDAAQALVDKTVEDLGSIDVLVNNAGITQDNLLLRMSNEQFDDVIKTNLNSIFYICKAAFKPMMRQRSGSIINMGSIVGVTGNAGQANYAASKAGMIGFTKSLAKEAASRGIRANVIAPGFIETEMTAEIPEAELKAWIDNIPLKRAGTTKDVADLCVFLGSDMSAYITGQVVHVNGGMFM